MLKASKKLTKHLSRPSTLCGTVPGRSSANNAGTKARPNRTRAGHVGHVHSAHSGNGPRTWTSDRMHLLRTTGNVLQVEHGSLYPALNRLERKGWVAAKWEL